MTDATLRPARRVRRGAVASLGMAAVLAASLPVNVAFMANSTDPASGGGFVEAWLRGGRTAEVTRLYNETFVLRDVGIDVFGTISWVLFGEGRPGVLAGTDGWLFSAEEFETDPGSPARVSAAADRIASVRDALAEQGIALTVALVPAKARIQADRLGSLAWPAEPRARMAFAKTALAERGVDAVDLTPALAEAAETAPAFLATDTHWSVAGAGAAADAVAAHVGAIAGAGPKTDYVLEAGAPQEHRGDLMRYIRLGPLESLLGPAPDRLVPLTAAGGGGDLFGEDEIPVALVGTSYSADARWSFEAQLKAALGYDVLNMAEEGHGPFEPMDAFLASSVMNDAPPKVVVWEIPERYLDDPLPAAGGRS